MEKVLGSARATFKDDCLSVCTGELDREWLWTGYGFLTIALANLRTGKQWCRSDPAHVCDWVLPGLSDERSPAVLTELTAQVSDDEGFTSEHLAVVASISYLAAKLDVQFVVWVYPDSPGIRTQLRVKGMPGYRWEERADGTLRADYVPVAFGQAHRRMLGYHNNTQRRNDAHLDLLHEVVVERPLSGPAWCDWCSVLCVEDDQEGLALVKESHKCVNQPGHDAGFFKCDPETGLESAGWGVLPHEIDEQRWRGGWAEWCLVYRGGGEERELAFKRFDRLRYPVDPERDLYVMANTWGSGTRRAGERGRDFAMEDIVLAEIDSQADLGIDVQQIDDGWQVPPGFNAWHCEAWRPHPDRYPEGWKRVAERARKKGVTLGLWAPAQEIPLEDLEYNYDRAGFRYYKLDFARLQSRDEIDALMDKVRAFIRYTGHQVRVNWDVTENPARYGYFFAREYGLLYLENRKPVIPPCTVYRPHTVLGDAWQAAKYLNLNKVQCSVQNVDRVDRERSDAWRHSHAYCVAITLMAAPLFFQLTQLYSPEAREQIRELLWVYKGCRDEMYRGYVFPVGDKPDNASWTGFQCYLPGENVGYLTVFRELYNGDAAHTIHARFLADSEIELTDLLSGEPSVVNVGADGGIPLRMDAPARFRFYRYVVC